MKNPLTKWLSALLIAALLLAPVALAEGDLSEIIPEANPEITPEYYDESDTDAVIEKTPELYEIIQSDAVDESVDEAQDVFIGEESELSGLIADIQTGLEPATADIIEENDYAPDDLLGAETDIVIDKNNFPDDQFRNWIASRYDNITRDGILSEAERSSVTKMEICSHYESVADLTGIKYFNSLSELTLRKTKVKALDVSGCTNLTNLYCIDNDQMVSLNASNCSGLYSLTISGKSLSSLNISNCSSLSSLACHDCPASFSTLDVSGFANLCELKCNGNQLTSLYASNCPKLAYIDCQVNCLTTLDVSNCPNLDQLVCRGTQLTSLDISNHPKLHDVRCDLNQLTSLTVRNCPYLFHLQCNNNLLTELDVSICPSLVHLNCSHNSLTQLVLNPDIKGVDCSYNSLSALDISNCGFLVPIITEENKTTNAPYGRIGSVLLYRNPDPGQDSYYLAVDSSVNLITGQTEPDQPSAATPTSTAATTTSTINATARNTTTHITAAPGTTAQLNLGGAAGKSFKSSNKKVATVDKNGNITFKKAGKVKITFKVGKKKRTVTIKVTDPTLPANVAFQPVNTAVKKGESVTLTPVVNEGANPGGFRWKSSNKKVATVKNGVVNFKKKGKVTITCTSKRGKKKAKVKFKVSN